MNKTFRFLSLVAGGALLVGCQEFDYGVTNETFVKKEYAKNFEKAFGEIDPDGTWNATRGGSVEVTVDELSQVMVYAKGLSTNLQLRCDVLDAGETKTIVFDAPQGVDEVYVIAKNMNHWQSQTIKIEANGKVNFSAASTRAAVEADNVLPSSYGYGPAHLISYVERAYTINKEGNFTSTKNDGIEDWYSYQGYNKSLKLINDSKYPTGTWGEWYSAYPWPYTSTETISGLDNDRNKQLAVGDVEVPHTHIALDESLENAIRNVVGTADNKQDVLQPYTQDIEYMTTVEPGEVELTYISKQTNSNNGIGYYYTFGNETTASLRAVKKYVLIPGINALETGDKFKLVYFGSNYDEEGTYNFPKDVTIHFFLFRGDNLQISPFNLKERQITSSWTKGRNPEDTYDVYTPNYTTYNDIYGITCQYAFFSDSELNDVMQGTGGDGYFGSFNFPATAAFNVMGRNCISFEDWPQAGSIDWNDAVFAVDAPFQDFSSFDEVESFVIAVEDLGNTYDFDYNDCVIRVSQSTTKLEYSNGTTKTTVNPATVTLLASGGTLPIAVTYNDQTLIAETHSAFGVESTVPVNVGANGGASKAAVTVEWTNAPTDLSMAVAAPKFKFIVTNDGSNTTVNVPTVTEGDNNIPVAFVIPDVQSWTWPSEGVNITSVYPDFANWVADNDDANAAYWYNYQWGKTYETSGNGGSGESGSGESGSGESGNTPEATVMTIGTSYDLLNEETVSNAAESSEWASYYVNYLTMVNLSGYSIPSDANSMTVTFEGTFSANIDFYNDAKNKVADCQAGTRKVTISKDKLSSISGKSIIIGSYNSFTISKVTVTLN